MNDILTAVFGTGQMGLITTTFMYWGLVGQDTRKRIGTCARRWFRPTSIRREQRAAIVQARSVLRLIESTHFFEAELGATIGGFLPRTDSTTYAEAFRRTYWDKAMVLYQTQRAWAGAAKPFPTTASYW